MNNHNDCQNRREAIAALVLGELQPKDADELEKHIDSCKICQSLYQALVDEEQTIRSVFKTIADRGQILQDMLVEQFSERGPATPADIRSRKTVNITWRTFMKSPITKLAAAAAIIAAISIFWFSSQQDSANGPDIFSGFSLLAKACAAEDAIFTGQDIVHIENEIIVYPVSFGEISSGQPESADFSKQVEQDFDELDTQLGFTWLPMCSMKANGQFAFNQLKLPIRIEPYTVIDQAWYEPATGYFARILQTEGKIVFANSYDGEFVYTSQIAPDGTLQLVKQLVTEEFRPPERPAEFLGIAAGLRSSLQQDTSMVQSVEQGTLWDGSPTHIYKVGTPDPQGQLKTFFLFKVRDEDETIAEKEFVVSGKTQLLIRRVLTESVQQPQFSWNLAEVEGLDVSTEAKPRVSITPDMVIPNVTVQHMVEKTSFETYVFATNPPWTGTPEIIDCIDPASFGKRMFIFAARADDGRHLVLVQSPTYNKMLGKITKVGRLVYTSPNGFKVWGGGPEKWYSKILLQSARASIKDPPADDRVGYMLESPAGTIPALAINGNISDEELHNLIDSLVPAKEYLKE